MIKIKSIENNLDWYLHLYIQMLEDISVEMEIPFPAKEEAYELFDNFNTDAGKDRHFIEK